MKFPALVDSMTGGRGGCLILFGKPARATKDHTLPLLSRQRRAKSTFHLTECWASRGPI